MTDPTETSHAVRRKGIIIGGTVQGIGFRPFVHRLATELGLTGFVNNDTSGVHVEIEGDGDRLLDFIRRLPDEAPQLAAIEKIATVDLPLQHDTFFEISESIDGPSARAAIPPDIAVCDDCLRELFDTTDRRYRYPFINCTNCGPRYTIVARLPYDRASTTMNEFQMCETCAGEYTNPLDRRFHAQPIACHDCGPRVSLYRDGAFREHRDPIQVAIKALREGKIVALRGLGGFHLAVDARNETAVRRLRERKRRPSRPFALMVDSIATAAEFCVVNDQESQLLADPRAAIVLMKKRADSPLAESLSIDNDQFGIMLAYTPLHHLLIRDEFEALVMTSGNLSDEPMAIGNDEAIRQLRGIADLFLLHNRDILQRSDDSIVAVYGSKPCVLRRARGFVPQPIRLQATTESTILAVGADLKNCPAVVRGRNVFPAQHVGDLDSPMALSFFEHAVAHLNRILNTNPRVIACDMHPEYRSTVWARKQHDCRVIPVQHHHAHLVSVMADNDVTETTIGLILDGTGYGLDNTIWGGEVLVGDASGFERVAYLDPVPMPGGEAATKEPWRMAAAYLHHCGIPVDRWNDYLDVDAGKLKLIEQAMARGINAPMTSSCGRLFDAVAGLLNLAEHVEYEAQAAIRLETLAEKASNKRGITEISSEGVTATGPIQTSGLIQSVLKDIDSGVHPESVAYSFHCRLAELLVASVLAVSRARALKRVGLSGGVWQNRLLFSLVFDYLTAAGLDVLVHRQVPCNDGGIALGQIVIAADQISDNGTTERKAD